MKTKRILATVLAIAMLASFISVPVFADEAVPTLLSDPVGEGYVCEDLGILVGPDEDGVTEEYLDTLAMRTQAAMVNLRLFGLEATALAFDGEATFEDAADATSYWQPILEYLKANPGMGWVGDEDGNFLPNEYITGQAFTKILLVSLGYEYGLDFDWETTMDFASEVGLIYLADKADDDLTVRDIAIAIVEALGLKTNSTTDITLLTQLVLEGIIDETVATEAGFEVGEPTLAIVNTYPSATDEVTVVLNMDLPEGTPITLKKGTAGYVVTEAVDGNTVKLTTLFELPAGTYTVMVGTETADFEVMTQYAVDLVITAESVYLAADQDLGVAMLDQYGDKMSLSLTNYSVFNQDSGYVFSTTPGTDLTIDVTEEPAEADEVIYVFVYDPASMLTVSAELPVLDAPVLSEITIGEVTNGDEDAAMLFQDTKDHILDLEGTDQYGNPYEISINDLIDGTIQYLLSNEECISFAGIVEGDIQFDTVKPGDFIFTFILPTNAFITTTEVLTVYPNPELDSIEIAGPAEAVYAEEEVTFPVVGLDQYGNLIDVDRDDDIMFTYTVDLDTEIGLEKGIENSIYFYAYDAGTTTIYYFLDGVFQGTFDVTVNEEAYPFQVVGINEIPTAFVENTMIFFNDTNIDVVDQYGRPISYETISDSYYDVIFWAEDDAESIEVDYEPHGDEYYMRSMEFGVQGTDTLYLGITNLDMKGATPESIYSFDAQLVGLEDLTSYSLDVNADLLCSNDAEWDNYDQILFNWSKLFATMIINDDHQKKSGLPLFDEDFLKSYTPYASPIIFRAYLEDGTEVGFGYRGIYSEDLIDIITFSAEYTVFDEPMSFEYQYDPSVLTYNDEEGTCVAKAWLNGEMVASTTFNMSKATPVVAEITAKVSIVDESTINDLFSEDNEDYLTHYIYMMESGIGESIFRLLDDENLDSEFGFSLLSQFDICDQYGVELPWEALLDAGEINIITSYVETADGVDLIVTMMTTNGVYYDSIRVENFEMRRDR